MTEHQIQQLIDSLKQATSYGWPELVRYTVINAVAGTVGWSVALLILIVLSTKFCLFMHHNYLDAKVDTSRLSLDKVDYYGPVVAAVILSFVAGLPLLCFAVNSAVVLLAPEGYIISQVIKNAR